MTFSIDLHSPNDGSLIDTVPVATAEEVESAVRFAHERQPRWARVDADERGEALRRAARALRDEAASLAERNEAETGRPRGEALDGVLAGAATLEQYAELGPVHRGRSLRGAFSATDLMVPEPRGVVVVLTPWNDPVAVACGLIGAALVAGNTVIHKPSERCPRTGALLGNIIAGTHPDGVLQHLDGDSTVGATLAADPDVDVIAHVGSTATGRSIAESAARTGAKTLLENGGNDPLVVDGDVDPQWAAEQAAAGAFANCGQICTAVERIYVHRRISEPFLDALASEATRRDLPPLVDVTHRDQVHEQVAEAVRLGARLRAGGTVPSGAGAHYPATVLTGCEPQMRVLAEETFGPVAPVRVIEGFDQGLAEAARDRYGLAATVLTASMEHAQRAWRALPVGTVKINAVFGGAPGGAAEPRGDSGHGFGFGPELLDELSTTKVVHIGHPGS
ncbi:aldehyde dehydrogenase family protein [Amycolatopsis aidingensis]|uniref:aldehyde dehydrogenase family protein n=1 Tax=Amycolatopsis aidingensis TaxID=2842453 RepID=UPI001C0DA495|nr:aldehyde dehydrogenase family protein [Amycolatopsis aidingensis]